MLIVLVGIIPGPKEPKYTINSYLTPLILELTEGWSVGFRIRSGSSHITIRVALACVSCDMPASRKVCGFLIKYVRKSPRQHFERVNQSMV